MKTHFTFSAVGTVLLLQGALAQPHPSSVVLSDSEIRKDLTERIDKEKQSVGIVVGIVEAAGRRIICYGRPAQNDNHPLNGDSVFQIASVTKVFTSLLLADMAQHGEVALADPAEKYLPAGVAMPRRAGRQITLQSSAMHTSGLPRDPLNPVSEDPDNPYSGYSVERLYQFLSTYKLTRDIDAQYEYSNLGGGLLGHILARRAGMDYGTLVRLRVCDPLGMNDTRTALTPEMKLRSVTGHTEDLKPVPPLDLPVIPGASALRSTANDLLIFLAANLGLTKSALALAMAAMIRVRRPSGSEGVEVALGWHILTIDGRDIIWHNGGLGGCGSFMGYDLRHKVGVVVLSNSAVPAVADNIGFGLLSTSR